MAREIVSWPTEGQSDGDEARRENAKGCDIGYAPAIGSCESAHSVDDARSMPTRNARPDSGDSSYATRILLNTGYLLTFVINDTLLASPGAMVIRIRLSSGVG